MRESAGKTSYTLIFVIIGALILGLMLLNICVGSVSIPVKNVLAILTGAGGDLVEKDIVMQLRFPRAVAALVLGAGLALSGYLLQTYFHNPVAGPYILGISSGAKLAVAAVLVFFAQKMHGVSSVSLILASFLGAMVSMGFVLLVARAVKNMAILLVAGVMIGYICSAITEFIITFAADADIVNLHNWSRGSFSGITWSNVAVMTVIIAACLFGVVLLSKNIRVYQMGESYARSVGVNVTGFRTILVLLSSLLTATVTAFAGPVSFVGIAVPHLIRVLFRTSDPRIIIPGCVLGGGVFCLLSDFLARMLLSPVEMSISTVTALFGAPVVIVMLIKRQKERSAA